MLPCTASIFIKHGIKKNKTNGNLFNTKKNSKMQKSNCILDSSDTPLHYYYNLLIMRIFLNFESHLYMDLIKVFDSVCRTRHWQKLSALGIGSNYLEWTATKSNKLKA